MQFPDYLPYKRKNSWGRAVLIALSLVIILGLLVYQIPWINRAVNWRWVLAVTYIDSVLNPVGKMPTPAMNIQPEPAVITNPLSEDQQPSPSSTPSATAIPPTSTPQVTPTATLIPTPTLEPTPLPMMSLLNPPPFDPVRDKEDLNNCGPATLALYLRYYGWKGDQYDIARVIKPTPQDANVNVDEVVYFVRTQAGWLNAEFRVGGNQDTLRKLLAAGFPVMIEETFTTDRQYLKDDDRWAGHYLLITGYDDRAQQFTGQDVEYGPNQKINYVDLANHWQSFNHVYIVVYRPEQAGTLQALLGADWDVNVNRQNALAESQKTVQNDPKNVFAWFNLGSNLVYFERYNEAAQAYDTARTIGLPMRMFRYQFGPFIAYFHAGRIDDLMALTKYALSITHVSEEAMLWRAWGFYRQGDRSTATDFLNSALEIRPGYPDALYALDYVNTH